ncbi:MAG: formyltransferase family protein [Rhodospirillaceae bacterium]|nr:formyltransferase family protein [Rhodospirillaceae bacterium]
MQQANQNRKKNIVFFTGYPRVDRLELIHDSNHSVSCVVVPAAKKYLKNLEPLFLFCQERSIRIEVIRKKNFDPIKDVSSKQNMLISSGYPEIIPEDVFSCFDSALNFHPTLLPKNRGRYLHYILTNREEYSGCTLHLIDSGVDSGPIVAQAKFPVTDFDTVKSLQRKSDEQELELLKMFLRDSENLIRSAKPQDHNQSTTYIEKRTPEDSALDESMTLKEAFYALRAFDPELYPGFIDINGERVAFTVRRLEKPAGEDDLI